MKKILSTIGILLSLTSFAQTDSLSVKEVIIYSIRGNENTPVSQKTFKSQDIQKDYQGQDIPFILNKQNPSILTYSDGGNYNGYQYFRLRGIDQTRINMTLNGVPLNEPEDQGAYFSNYPDFSKNLSSMQVQRGIGISSNGVASYGGSINFESFDLKTDKSLDINVGYGSFNTKRLSIGLNTKLGEKIYFYNRYSTINSQGYRNNSGTVGHTYFYSGAYYNKKNILKLTGFFGESKNQMAYLASPLDSIKVNRQHNPLSPNENDDFIQNHIQLQWTRDLHTNIKLVNTVYYNYLQGNYNVAVNPDILNFKLNSNFYGVISNLLYSKRNFDANLGLHVYSYDRTHSMALKPNSIPLYTNTGYKREYSAFTKLSYKVGKFTPYIDLQIRSIEFSYSPEKTYNLSFNPINWTFFNPKFGLTYNMFPNIVFYSFIGQTHREPTRNDMLGGADDIDPINYVDVSNFKRISPEKVINFELGTKIRTQRLVLDVNYFLMEFKNEIAAIGQLSYIGLPLRKNILASTRQGIELDIKYNLWESFKLWGNAMYMTSNINRYTTDYDNITYQNVTPLLTPNIITNVGVDLKLLKRITIGTDIKYITSSYLDNTNNKELILPEYYVMNLNCTFNIHSFSLVANLNNILDTKYFTSGYAQGLQPFYYVGPTRNTFITINKKF